MGVTLLLISMTVGVSAERVPSQLMSDALSLSGRELQIVELMENYGLMDKDVTSPALKLEDLNYWVQSPYSVVDIEKKLMHRYEVLKIASEVQVIIPTQGDLSFYAEALKSNQMTRYDIRMELIEKKKKDIWFGAETTKEKIDTIRKKELEVYELAMNQGLVRVEGFAPVFTKGDGAYWSRKGWSDEELLVHFKHRREVIDLAKRAGYILPNQGDLSYFAEQLQTEAMTEPQLSSLFRRKVV